MHCHQTKDDHTFQHVGFSHKKNPIQAKIDCHFINATNANTCTVHVYIKIAVGFQNFYVGIWNQIFGNNEYKYCNTANNFSPMK